MLTLADCLCGPYRPRTAGHGWRWLLVVAALIVGVVCA